MFIPCKIDNFNQERSRIRSDTQKYIDTAHLTFITKSRFTFHMSSSIDILIDDVDSDISVFCTMFCVVLKFITICLSFSHFRYFYSYFLFIYTFTLIYGQ